MLAIYYAVLILAGVLLIPFVVLKKKARAGLWQKLGHVPAVVRSEPGTSPLWFHSVSVGEFNAVWPLVSAVHAKYPEVQIVISTTTRTGQEHARERAGSFARVIYFPFDIPWAVNNWLNAIRPSAVMVVETELWPGFYNECHKRDIPVVVVNGRISPRSYKRYQSVRALFGKALSQTSLILAQSKEEKARYSDLTGGAARIAVTGNLKFDGLKAISAAEQSALYQQLNLTSGDLVFVAGSTHEGEEIAVLRATEELRKSGFKPRLIIVPRHPERFNRAAELIQASGFNVRRFSNGDRFTSDDDVYLLDAIGHLMRFYSVAQIAFVGGTLVPIGGHNLVEPSIYSVPVVCGPHVEKTRDVARALIEIDALLLANSENELVANVKRLASDPELRQKIGTSACSWLAQSQGAVQRALLELEQFPGLLPSTDQATRPKPSNPNDFAEVTR